MPRTDSPAVTSDSREDYLKQIWLLQQRTGGDAAPMGKLAERLGVAGASVTGMVKSLVEDGLVEYEPYRGVWLTRKGRAAATRMVRRHRLVELFLVETIGLDWSQVHEEAERLEHAISDRLLDRIDELLGHPETDPHGDPIPTPGGKVAKQALRPLSRCEPGERVRIVRVTDQATKFLRFVDRSGLRPGAEVTLGESDPSAETIELAPVNAPGLTLAMGAAGKLWVEAIA